MTTLRRALALVAMLGGCEQKAPPPPAHGLPPLSSTAAPGTLPHAEHPPAEPDLVNPHAAMPPGHPGAEPADPHGGGGASMEALSPGEIQFDKNTVISGMMKLSTKMKDKVKKGDVIFLVARGAGDGTTPGPVLAVRRLLAEDFPMAFQIDSRDAMVVGTQMQGPIVVTARVDKDGDAMSKNPGDVTGSVTVKSLPAAELTLLIDKEL